MRFPRKVAETAQMLAEGMARIAHEYKDIDRIRRDGIVWYDGVVYIGPLVASERLRLWEATRSIAGQWRLPAGHEVELVSLRGTWTLWARVGGSSAEGATQILTTLVRRALTEAGLTVDEMRVEVQRAEEVAA